MFRLRWSRRGCFQGSHLVNELFLLFQSGLLIFQGDLQVANLTLLLFEVPLL